jgi:Saxitoxin biosynthesis operon protein SxtJ
MKQDPTLPEHQEHNRSAPAGSERGFGFVFATVFALVGAWPAWFGGAPRWWALALGAAFLLAALLAPRILRPLNGAWLAFGRLLHRVVSPLVLGMLFYFTVVPTGVVMRLLGKDPLRLRFDRAARSYWLERKPPGPPPESLHNQF